jgi:hypothetical protein
MARISSMIILFGYYMDILCRKTMAHIDIDRSIIFRFSISYDVNRLMLATDVSKHHFIFLSKRTVSI